MKVSIINYDPKGGNDILNFVQDTKKGKYTKSQSPLYTPNAIHDIETTSEGNYIEQYCEDGDTLYLGLTY
jgi:hypothetical protein